MKYCPNCRAEFVDEASACQDCETELISEAELKLQDAAEEDFQRQVKEFVKVETLADRFIADLVSDALTQEDIPFIIKKYEEIAYDGLFAFQKGWGDLMVPESFLDRATAVVDEVLAEAENGGVEEEDDEEAEEK